MMDDIEVGLLFDESMEDDSINEYQYHFNIKLIFRQYFLMNNTQKRLKNIPVDGKHAKMNPEEMGGVPEASAGQGGFPVVFNSVNQCLDIQYSHN
jgi:hypothetical protein